jgi:hypothetical protein
MSIARSVAEVLREHVELEVEAIDRMYLNVYVPHLQSVGAVVGYLRVHRGQRFASTAAVTPMTEAFVRNIDQFVNHEGPVEMRAAASRVREAQVAETSTKATGAADAQSANQPTAPAIYSVASYERPAAWPLPSVTPSSTAAATIAAPPSAASLGDEHPTASAPTGMQAPRASDPIRPIPVKTVKAELPSTFGTPAREQIEILEAHRGDASARQSSAPLQALVKPQLALLAQKAGMLGTVVSRDNQRGTHRCEALPIRQRLPARRTIPAGAFRSAPSLARRMRARSSAPPKPKPPKSSITPAC